MGQAVVHLLGLLGYVNVHRQARALCISGQLVQRGRCDGAQRMQGHADVNARVVGRLALHRFDDAGNGIRGGRKAALVLAQAGGGEARAHVEGGQQGQADTGGLGGTHQGQGHFCRVGIGCAARVIVQVVEFADLGVAALQ